MYYTIKNINSSTLLVAVLTAIEFSLVDKLRKLILFVSLVHERLDIEWRKKNIYKWSVLVWRITEKNKRISILRRS